MPPYNWAHILGAGPDTSPTRPCSLKAQKDEGGTCLGLPIKLMTELGIGPGLLTPRLLLPSHSFL